MLLRSPLVSSAARFQLLSPPSLVFSLHHCSIPNPALLLLLKSHQISSPRLRPRSRGRGLFCRANRSDDALSASAVEKGEALAGEEKVEGLSHGDGGEGDRLSVGIGSPNLPMRLSMYRMSLGDQAFFLLAFIACTTSIAFTSLVIAAVPTLYAMKRAATSLAKLADTAREELPSTMAAVRLSGMEISDLTLELSDLSQEIADGVNKSAQAVQAAEAGVRQIGALARQKTISMIEERASLPNISFQPVVAGAARKTSNAVDQAKKTFMNLISRSGDYSSDSGEEGSDEVEC